MATASSAPASPSGLPPSGPLTYRGYLRLAELLAAQVPVVRPPARDELAFIVTHQTYELWFKLLLADLELVRDEMFAGRPAAASRVFERIHVVGRVLLEQLAVLEFMTPADFAEFRDALAPASGLQSAQFRELEFLSGREAPDPPERACAGLGPEERDAVLRRLAEPSVWDGFRHLLGEPDAGGRGAGEAVGEDSLTATLARVAAGQEPGTGELRRLAAHLYAYDEEVVAWRTRHADLAARLIGDAPGTGGTSGVDYLRRTARRRFYPLLHDLFGACPAHRGRR